MRKSDPRLRRGLYLISPDVASVTELQKLVLPVLGSAALIQLRCKTATARARLAQAEYLRAATVDQGIPLIINDDVALALAVAADGVHLGREDGAIAVARESLGNDAIIGASCYGDFALAQSAIASGADYVAFGAVFPSPTKPLAPTAPLGLLKQASEAGMHSVAIGGITPETIDSVVDAGADMAAVISGIYDAVDPVAAAARCAGAFESHN